MSRKMRRSIQKRIVPKTGKKLDIMGEKIAFVIL